ncbi:hypothetical protein [Nitrospira sp. Nam80]
MSNRRTRWTVLYLVFLFMVGAATFAILRSIIAIVADDHNVPSPFYGDYGDILNFSPRNFDPNHEGGHLRPNLNGWMKGETLGHPVRIITNSKGFRNGREFAYAVPPRTFRILFLGDSYVDGMRTSQNRTVGYVLEELLNREACNDRFDNYEVMISGHNNPTNAWYYFQEFGYRYHADLVLLGVTLGNDLTWHPYQSTFKPDKDNFGNTVLRYQQGGPHTKGVQDWFPENAYLPREQFLLLKRIESRLRTWAHDFFPKWTGYAVPAATYPSSDERRHVDMQDFSTSLGLFYIPPLPQIEDQYRTFLTVADEFARAVAKRSQQFAMVLFPTRLQASSREWSLFLKFYFLDTEKFDMAYPNRRISKFCHEHSLTCWDLLPSFQQHYAGSDTPLYMPHGDMHFNDAGQELAAQELFSFLKRQSEEHGLAWRPCVRHGALALIEPK